jgi:hypothetical protein
MTRESIQKLLRSKEVDLPGWAESAEHLAGVERLLGVLAEPTPESVDAGCGALEGVALDDLESAPIYPAKIWRAMWSARFGDGG